MRPPALVLVLLALAGCADSAPPVGGPAPDTRIESEGKRFHLADARGQAVVMQFAPADSVEAWAVLAGAAADLTAEGALVVGISTDGAPPTSPFQTATDAGGRAAAAYGYTGRPLAVVIDAAGVLRGLAAPRRTDDLFALAAPVLLETAPASVPAFGASIDADAVEGLRRRGAVVVDVRADAERVAEGPVPFALEAPLERLDATMLPADFAATLVVVGTDATEAAARMVGWGYANVLVVPDASGLADRGAPEPPRPAAAPRRVRG